MIPDKQLTDEDRELMTRYGITHESKTVYFYEGHKYDKLGDAVRYARHTLERVPGKDADTPR